MEQGIKVCVACVYPSLCSSRAREQLVTVSQPGMCRYGSRLDCCYGWKKNNKGHCEAICRHGCKYGECTGPNKCRCFPGFTGKTCSQDLNECGLKPRPCEHRCMNTHGSYKCYCLNGYMLIDGTCTSSRSCAMANCQYGCEEVKGEIQCLCPSGGLQLGPNRRMCIDIDECSTGQAVCSYNRRCVNTFGSYYCKCQLGYELKYVSSHYDCVDVNECVTNTHRCNLHAECLNTEGSFKCKCKQGYRGNGFDCAVIPEKSVKEIPRIPGTAKDTIKKLLAHKNTVKKYETIKNAIPEVAVTPASETHLQLLDYEGGFVLGGSYAEEKKEEEAEESDEEEMEDFENQIDHEQSLRGDVFSLGKLFSLVPKVKEAAAFGPLLAQREIPVSRPEQEVDCSFSRGVCDWKQDADDDFDWNPADRDRGDGYYMAVPGFVGHKNDMGRLKLLLSDLKPKSSYCLIFSYRLAGERVGKLRVFLADKKPAPVWEQNKGKDERWRTGKIEIFQGTETTNSVTFESERGKGKTGEIGVDNVILISGLCPEDT
ncbi:epidermal growth factor-like protein 6 [Columba guinea]|nr:epidermal growth factor-like protein 6 [Columba guinea]